MKQGNLFALPSALEVKFGPLVPPRLTPATQPALDGIPAAAAHPSLQDRFGIPLRMASCFKQNRKLGRSHQNVLVFYNGAVERIREVLPELKDGFYGEQHVEDCETWAATIGASAEKIAQRVRGVRARLAKDFDALAVMVKG
jgi:hypothetical protein